MRSTASASARQPWGLKDPELEEEDLQYGINELYELSNGAQFNDSTLSLVNVQYRCA
jgi:hypothetical protein